MAKASEAKVFKGFTSTANKLPRLLKAVTPWQKFENLFEIYQRQSKKTYESF